MRPLCRSGYRKRDSGKRWGRKSLFMSKVWRCLGDVGIGVGAVWGRGLGDEFAASRKQFLYSRGLAKSFPCPRDCGCAHAVVPGRGDSFVGVCQCEPWNCEDIALTREDIVLLQVNWPKVAGAVCKAFGFDVRGADLGVGGMSQIGAFSARAVPVVLGALRERQD